MFFIGIFGVENKNKEIKILDNISCKICKGTVTGKLIKNYNFFHFFFIPLFKWNETYYVKCTGCKSLYTISKDKGKAIENGENIEITYWDLQEVNIQYNSNDYFRENICLRCGREIDSNFTYCPHCGERSK